MNMINNDVIAYNEKQTNEIKPICQTLASEISKHLKNAEHKVWHGHPVWFLDGNPIVGYSKLKNCIQILFWSGQSFDEENLAKSGSFKAAEFKFNTIAELNILDLKRWVKKSAEIQWDYKNIIKRKGVLERLK
jgi:uncharacterized protein YdhG (YjbR/CyaY superfamily)